VITEQRFTFGEDKSEVISKVTKRNFLIQIKAHGDVDVQLIISSYKDDETGKFVMYIGSMVTS
jgi:predicted transcriptional regulator YdeE